ncbi:DEAD/DEAH box helicase [Ghiorsea bivora]|uniref:DEAD/DEAH box helicase n=1 Tax=Ghiorsea bivora TaxID=1485545 RepID=UPI0009DE1B15|nr:DEAD/DEAH box helicase [Ghiorsea bivora]
MISSLISKIKSVFKGKPEQAAEVKTPHKPKRPARKPKAQASPQKQSKKPPRSHAKPSPQTKKVHKPHNERIQAKPAEPIKADDDWVAEKETEFTALELPNALLHAIDDLGYTELSAVQKIAFPITMAGKDIAGQGRTGTGKTATFLITAIKNIIENPAKSGRKTNQPRVLVIAPTRELVIQIASDAKKLTKYTNINVHAVFGGVDYEKQQKPFETGVEILIGTPGRLIDFHKKHCYDLQAVDVMVLDEADRMFDLGFIKDLRFLLRRLPKYNERQSLMFSATLSHRVMELAYEHMNNPEKVQAETGDITAASIVESMYHTAMDEKLPLLIHLLKSMDVQRGMVFINEKRTGEKLAADLAKHGFNVGIISGDVQQRKRMKILEMFTKGELKLLIATDVASRGIHVDDITHVFNYDLPEDAESYVHRIGRTGRAGANGVAISFACERYCFEVPAIEAYIKKSIPVKEITPDMIKLEKPTNPTAKAEGLKAGDAAEKRPRQGGKGGNNRGGNNRSGNRSGQNRRPRRPANK